MKWTKFGIRKPKTHRNLILYREYQFMTTGFAGSWLGWFDGKEFVPTVNVEKVINFRFHDTDWWAYVCWPKDLIE